MFNHLQSIFAIFNHQNPSILVSGNGFLSSQTVFESFMCTLDTIPSSFMPWMNGLHNGHHSIHSPTLLIFTCEYRMWHVGHLALVRWSSSTWQYGGFLAALVCCCNLGISVSSEHQAGRCRGGGWTSTSGVCQLPYYWTTYHMAIVYIYGVRLILIIQCQYKAGDSVVIFILLISNMWVKWERSPWIVSHLQMHLHSSHYSLDSQMEVCLMWCWQRSDS